MTLSRRGGEITGSMNEREFPHISELPLPLSEAAWLSPLVGLTFSTASVNNDVSALASLLHLSLPTLVVRIGTAGSCHKRL